VSLYHYKLRRSKRCLQKKHTHSVGGRQAHCRILLYTCPYTTISYAGQSDACKRNTHSVGKARKEPSFFLFFLFAPPRFFRLSICLINCTYSLAWNSSAYVSKCQHTSAYAKYQPSFFPLDFSDFRSPFICTSISQHEIQAYKTTNSKLILLSTHCNTALQHIYFICVRILPLYVSSY
jgi:hypothetical protein